MKFGPIHARESRHCRFRSGDTWQLDRVFIKINDEWKRLRRAGVQSGMVLDTLVQNRHDTATARRFFRRLPKKTGAVPRVITTDEIRSRGATYREVMPCVVRQQPKYSNRGAEKASDNSPTGHSVALLCRALEVPLSAHYAHQTTVLSRRAARCFEAPRIQAALRRARRTVNGKRAERLVRKHRIAGITRRLTLHLPERWPWSEDFSQLFRAVHAPPPTA